VIRNFVRWYLRHVWRKECDATIKCKDCKYGCGKLYGSKYGDDCVLDMAIYALYKE